MVETDIEENRSKQNQSSLTMTLTQELLQLSTMQATTKTNMVQPIFKSSSLDRPLSRSQQPFPTMKQKKQLTKEYGYLLDSQVGMIMQLNKIQEEDLESQLYNRQSKNNGFKSQPSEFQLDLQQ